MIYTADKARFTVMCEGVIRIEYSEDCNFTNGKTLFAERGAECNADISCGEVTCIKTKKITLYYHGGEFSKDTLYADIHTGNLSTRWHFGDANMGNLKGTLHTLDGVSCFKELPEGLLSRDGWYVVDDSGTPYFDNDWIKNRASSHTADLYLFAYGKDYKATLRDLAAVSGKFPLPRKYFFGSWYSRWWPYTAADFISLADQYDEHDFPLDVLVMDMDWHYQDWGHQDGEPEYNFGYGHAGANLGWTGYTWNRRLIPDPEGLLSKLKERGIAVTLNDHPADGVRDTDDVYDRFMENLAISRYKECVPTIEDKVNDRERAHIEKGIKNFRFNAGSKEYMEAFFDATGAEMEEKGAAFRWLDWQQDYLYPNVNGMNNLSHLKWLNHLYYEYSKRNGKRGMSFSRWGGFGDHKHPAYFSGDTASTWEALEFEVQMTVSAGNAGCFWWSHDIGGFMETVPGGQSELYARWVQFGALSPALRLHMCGVEGFDRRPWTWGEPYCSVMREAFHLRSTLMPYIYSEAKASCESSLPLLRALYIEHPEDEEAYRHPEQYYFGNGIMTAPICRKMEDENGYIESEIYLPEGVWYDWFTGERYEAGLHTVKNTLNTFPLFILAGYPVVTMPYSSRMTSEKLTAPIIKIGAGASGESFIYEDDGITDTEPGLYRKTHVMYDDNTRALKLTPEVVNYDDGVKERDITVMLIGSETITSAICSEHKVEVEKKNRTIFVTVKGVAVNEEVGIKFE